MVWTALCRPQGAARSLSCQALAAGGMLESVWRDVCPTRVRSSRARVADGIGVDTPPRHQPTPDELRRRTAIFYVYRGEPSKARHLLESTGRLGTVDADDVLTTGPLGDFHTATPGTVVAEMLAKHPPPPPDSDKQPKQRGGTTVEGL